MSEGQFINIVEVGLVIVGMFFVLVLGYVMGYRDGKRDRKRYD